MDVKNALILSGGESRRMGQDKSSLLYDNVAQYKRIYTTLANIFEHVYFSIGHSNQNKDLLHYPHILDIENKQCGPLLGILSALFHKQDEAWFVVAIDMPAITEKMIRKVLELRQAYKKKYSTIHASVAKGSLTPDKKSYLEPLFGIYEAAIRATMHEQFLQHKYSLQKLLQKPSLSIYQMDTDDIGGTGSDALKNINTYEEYMAYKCIN